MNRDFQIRFTAGLLILLTTAAVILAWINFQKEADFQIPSDGVWWMEQAGNDGGVPVNANTVSVSAMTGTMLVVWFGSLQADAPSAMHVRPKHETSSRDFISWRGRAAGRRNRSIPPNTRDFKRLLA